MLLLWNLSHQTCAQSDHTISFHMVQMTYFKRQYVVVIFKDSPKGKLVKFKDIIWYSFITRTVVTGNTISSKYVTQCSLPLWMSSLCSITVVVIAISKLRCWPTTNVKNNLYGQFLPNKCCCCLTILSRMLPVPSTDKRLVAQSLPFKAIQKLFCVWAQQWALMS